MSSALDKFHVWSWRRWQLQNASFYYSFLLRSHTESLRLGHSNLDSLWSSFCFRITSSFTDCISFTIVRVVLTEKIWTLYIVKHTQWKRKLSPLQVKLILPNHVSKSRFYVLDLSLLKPQWLRPIEHCCLVVGCAEIQLKLTRHNNNTIEEEVAGSPAWNRKL